MALTALAHIINGMGHLAKLKAGGTPSSDQQAAFLILLNEDMEELQLMGALGATITETLTGRSDGTTISSAGAVTRTNVQGTTTTVATPVAVSTFATTGTTNTYPVGWDAVIDYRLAVRIAGAQGAVIPDYVLEGAKTGLATLLGAVAKGPAAPGA